VTAAGPAARKGRRDEGGALAARPALLLFVHRIAERPPECQLCAPVSALDEGVYSQHTPLKTIREHGDFAAGTLDDLDREMVMLDGRTFHLTANGRVNEVGEGATTPLARVTYFEPISHDDLPAELDSGDFRSWIHDGLPRAGGSPERSPVFESAIQPNARPTVSLPELVAASAPVDAVSGHPPPSGPHNTWQMDI